jgi:hypothetical protein
VSVNLENWLRDYARFTYYAFVAHSMGGLIARKMIASQPPLAEARLDTRVLHVSLIASPNNGSVLASLAGHVPGLGSAQLTDLRPDSSFLLELNAQWGAWAGANVPSHCTLRCLYGTKDKIVLPGNATALDPQAIPFYEDHISLPKRPEIVPALERVVRESRFLQMT